MLDISVSLISTNEKALLKKCLDSIYGTIGNKISYEIFVVDNVSDDGTQEMLKMEYPNVKVIRNETKKSFCENHNMVIRASSGEFVLIMNSDVIVMPGYFEVLLNTIKADPKLGCVMGKLLLGEPSSSKKLIDSTGVIIHKSRRTEDRGQEDPDIGQYEKKEEIFSASGAAMLCRRKMLEDIKMDNEYFDETFFAYKEELDLCWRSRLFGWNILYDPRATIYHLRAWGRSTNRKKIKPFIRRHSYKNRYLMMIKNDQLENVIRHFPHILWHEIKALGYMILREPHLFIAWWQIIRSLPSTFKKRSQIMQKAVIGPDEIRKWFI